jgi:hypothetical protein
VQKVVEIGASDMSHWETKVALAYPVIGFPVDDTERPADGTGRVVNMTSEIPPVFDVLLVPLAVKKANIPFAVSDDVNAVPNPVDVKDELANAEAVTRNPALPIFRNTFDVGALPPEPEKMVAKTRPNIISPVTCLLGGSVSIYHSLLPCENAYAL